MKIMKHIFYRIRKYIPDVIYIKIQYKNHIGEKLNLVNPNSFSEKIQWLKLYDRKPEYITYVDKYAVREHISKIIGEKYLNEVIDVYDNVDEIEWNKLPNKFVLKCSHGSACNIICENKSQLDIMESKKKLSKWMKTNWYWYGREWPYKNVKPKIICEKYLQEAEGESLTDYKIYCFNGEPFYCQVIRGRGKNETIDFYDKSWNHMPFTGLRNLPMSNKEHVKPEKYEEMFNLARLLSKKIPFIRVDFFYNNYKIIFGELTFYPVSGFGQFKPKEWNYKIGSLIKLPDKREL